MTMSTFRQVDALPVAKNVPSRKRRVCAPLGNADITDRPGSA
jgi:hypothetical protein